MNNYISIGVKSEISKLMGWDKAAIPIQGMLLLIPNKDKTRPYFLAEVGVNFYLNWGATRNGFRSDLGLGINIPVKRRHAIQFAMAWDSWKGKMPSSWDVQLKDDPWFEPDGPETLKYAHYIQATIMYTYQF